MDKDRVRIALIKQCRRDLIAALNMAYPYDMSFEDLCAVMPTTEEHYVTRDVQYFMDKGYVAWMNSRSNAAWKGRKFRLTAMGIDIATKVNVDPALEP